MKKIKPNALDYLLIQKKVKSNQLPSLRTWKKAREKNVKKEKL